MLLNEHVAVKTSKILLVPYCAQHVEVYHDWMKDPDIQVATASEPLSLMEEYAMQRSWRNDTDKLTFILCHRSGAESDLESSTSHTETMIGDVNMFISVHEEDDGGLSLVGEIELMIATKDYQHQGYGRAALLTFLNYILQHEEHITKQHHIPNMARKNQRFDYLSAKIKEDNERSILLFQSAGFVKTSDVPNFFGEFELRSTQHSKDKIVDLLEKYGIRDYQEVEFAE